MKEKNFIASRVVAGRRTLGREGRGPEAGVSGRNKSQHQRGCGMEWGGGGKGGGQRRQQGGRGPGVAAPGVRYPGGPWLGFVAHSSVTHCALSGVTTQR